MVALPANVHVFDNADAIARAAAAAVLEVVASSRRARIAVCLSGGSTPKHLYQLLLEPPHAAGIPWDRMHWFWGDERFVPLADQRSNAGMACSAFLKRARAPLETIHVIPVTSGSAAHSADRYEQELKEFYGAGEFDPARPLFDLVLLDLGEDGHTASLFPGSPALGERRRWVTAIEEAGREPYVPRITLTFAALQPAQEVLFLVSGAAKQRAMARILAGDDVPAARVRPNGRLRWFVDHAALPENVP